MMGTDIIVISKLKKSFNQKPLFNGFNIRIKRNSIHAIIGPNGSGKTTLLRLLTGLYSKDSGDITVNGSHCMLLENDYLYEDKTGLENIKIFGLYFGYGADFFQEYADLLNLTEHLRKRVSSYSKGMKRKLSLLIVILINREIIYLDEPTSGVDPISRIEIRNLIEKLKEAGKTIIITSHDLSEIEKTADYVTMIQDGNLIFNKKVEDIGSESLEDVFIKEGAKYG